MPSTPEAASRDVNAASDECRKNASKNRKENDWFGHDAGSRNTASVSVHDNRPRSSAAPRTPNNSARESEEWFRYDGNGTPTSSGPGADVTSRARDREQDWYKHGTDVPDPPSLEKRSKGRSRRSACTEVRQKATDPNDWFRHDHAKGSGTIPERPSKKPSKVASPTSLWVVYSEDGTPTNPADRASTPRSHSRLTSKEADEYYRRDKVGTSTEWFSHDHQNLVPDQATSTRATPQGTEIANRLKGESENWFSHEGNENYVSPLPVGKGHSPLSKELMDRAQGSEIKQVFQMEHLIRTTWKAPLPLLEPEVVVVQGPSSSADDSAVENVRGTMENLLSNGLNNGATTAH